MKTTLTLAYVGFGGNTGEGRYFYAFDPATLFVQGQNKSVTFALASDVADDFRIAGIAGSGDGSALKSPSLGPDERSITVTDDVSRRELVNVSVVVRDTKRDILINCDPQMLNSPDPW